MSGDTPQSPGGSVAASISNRVVQLLNSYTGRGPTRAWTVLDDELISVVLRDSLSKGERRLVGDGRRELVLRMRKAYQDTMRNDLVAAVEELSGRTVIAFLSDSHIDPDIAIESFVLEPRSQPQPESGTGDTDGRSREPPS